MGCGCSLLHKNVYLNNIETHLIPLTLPSLTFHTGKFTDGYNDLIKRTILCLLSDNCDLHFKVSRDRYSGYPLTIEGFAYLWAGARATHGVNQGRVCYEMKVGHKTFKQQCSYAHHWRCWWSDFLPSQINEEIPVKHLPSSEPDPHVVRIGWSLNHCSTQLGE